MPSTKQILYGFAACNVLLLLVFFSTLESSKSTSSSKGSRIVPNLNVFAMDIEKARKVPTLEEIPTLLPNTLMFESEEEVKQPQTYERIGYAYVENTDKGESLLFEVPLTFHCNTMYRYGQLNEGGWEICLDYIRDNDCVVYSAGLHDPPLFEFELALHQELNCEVHLFDPGSNAQKILSKVSLPPKLKYHPVGFSNSDGYGYLDVSYQEHLFLKRIPTAMTDLNHKFLDVLKLDIDGTEYDLFSDFSNNQSNVLSNVGQLVLKLHWDPRVTGESIHDTAIKADNIIAALSIHQFEAFHKSERNENNKTQHYHFIRKTLQKRKSTVAPPNTKLQVLPTQAK